VIEVYAFSTPNSVRVPIALEELGLDYELKPVNVKKAEQKSPDFLALNPNGKVPLLIDPDGPAEKPFTLTESGAILIYLAEKTGRLLPHALPCRGGAYACRARWGPEAIRVYGRSRLHDRGYRAFRLAMAPGVRGHRFGKVPPHRAMVWGGGRSTSRSASGCTRHRARASKLTPKHRPPRSTASISSCRAHSGTEQPICHARSYIG
jgi:hypothetical protein